MTTELVGEGNGTEVSLTQNHFATEEKHAHSEKDWEMMLARLKKHVEQ